MDSKPQMGAVFWPVKSGDSTTIVVSDDLVMQVDLRDLASAHDDDTPEMPVVDSLVEALPKNADGDPYLAVFALTHADKDHCLGFADLLGKVVIGELWATPRLWREYLDADDDDVSLCDDAKAFQEEADRRVEVTRKAVADGEVPASGDRIIIIGTDGGESRKAYEDLPDEYLSGPGQTITRLDHVDCGELIEVFIHAPFADDAAKVRNDTSLAMHLTLTNESQTGRVLMFGDLAYATIMKIFDYSEYHDREQYLAFDLMLAPHHCSKKVMYVKDAEGVDRYRSDIMEAFERHAEPEASIIASSAVIPGSNSPGDNPPHRKAANRYEEIVDDFICTMSWPSDEAPVPVVFTVDATGAGVVREDTVELAASAVLSKSAASPPFGRRLAAVTAAATVAAETWSQSAHAAEFGHQDGPSRLREAIAADRGGDKAPEVAVGFGQ